MTKEWVNHNHNHGLVYCKILSSGIFWTGVYTSTPPLQHKNIIYIFVAIIRSYFCTFYYFSLLLILYLLLHEAYRVIDISSLS